MVSEPISESPWLKYLTGRKQPKQFLSDHVPVPDEAITKLFVELVEAKPTYLLNGLVLMRGADTSSDSDGPTK